MIHLPFAENYGKNHCRVRYSQVTQSPVALERQGKKIRVPDQPPICNKGGAFLM